MVQGGGQGARPPSSPSPYWVLLILKNEEEGCPERTCVFPGSPTLSLASGLHPKTQGHQLHCSPQDTPCHPPPAWPTPRVTALAPACIRCLPGQAKTLWTPDSGREIPARQSVHCRRVYWQNLFPSIKGKRAAEWVTFFSLSLAVFKEQEGEGRKTPERMAIPAADVD